MAKRAVPFGLLLVFVSVLALGITDPPALLNYQGVLRSSTDAPLTGTFDMIFRFFSASVGGDEILVDRHTAGAGGQVQVTGGLFNVQLGSGTISDGSGPGTFTSLRDVFSAYTDVHLEVQVSAEVLSPRTRLVSAASALNSSRLQGKTSSDFALFFHEHSGSQITSGKIGNAFLNTGSGNGLDADTVDGVHASGLVQSTNPNTQSAVSQLTGTFEWEAGRVMGVSTSYVTVTFTTPFTEYYPVIIVTGEGDPTGNEQVVIRNVTKSSFEVRMNSGQALTVNYFACTPGIWLVDGNLIYAMVYGGATQSREIAFVRNFSKTPSIQVTGCANANQDPQTSGVVYALQTLPTTVTTDLDAGTRGAFVGINAGTSPCLQVLAIASTTGANNGGTYTSRGSASFKAGNKFESGFFRVPGPLQTGTVTFSSLFTTNPIVVLTGVNTDAVNNNAATANLTSLPGTTSFSWVNNNWPLGMMWLAIDPGHDSTQATRLF